MAKTESVTLDHSFTAPDFTLPDAVTGDSINLNEYAAGAQATIIMIICNHCTTVVQKHVLYYHPLTITTA